MNLKQIYEVWLEPEIERRRAAGTLTEKIEVRRALIRFLPGKVVVQFNNEVSFRAKAKYKVDGEPAPGTPVMLHEIDAIEDVNPPALDGKRCNFIYLYVSGRGTFSTIFDFSPSWPEFDEDDPWNLGQQLAGALNLIFSELTVKSHQSIDERLRAFGLVPSPAIVPSPHNRIVKHVADQELDEANRLLCQHCTSTWLASRLKDWLTIPYFAERDAIFRSALANHGRGDYIASLHTLVPQVEGIIKTYSLDRVGGSHRPGPDVHADRIKKRVKPRVPDNYTYQAMVDMTFDFIRTGPLYKHFSWRRDIVRTFPSRHAITHGKTKPDDFTEARRL